MLNSQFSMPNSQLNQSHQAFDVGNVSRDLHVPIRPIRHRAQARGVLFRRDQHLAAQIFNFAFGVAMVIAKAHVFYRMDSERFQRMKEPFRLRDTRKCDDGAIRKLLGRNPLVILIYTLYFGSNRK